jgi:hypothetical protein
MHASMSLQVVGSSTACIATLDYELDQLTFRLVFELMLVQVVFLI